MENAFLRLKLPDTQDGVVGHRRDIFTKKDFEYSQALRNSTFVRLSTHTDPSVLGGDLLSGTGVLSYLS